MLINILKARTDGQTHQTTVEFEADSEFLGVEIVNPVKVKIDFSVLKNDVFMDLEIAYNIKSVCALCAEDVVFSDTIFQKEVVKKEAADEDDYTYSGDNVEIDKIINDAILLNAPSQILCAPDCKGLCPICGKNQNIEICNCKNSDSPFSQLQDLTKLTEE